MNKLYKETNNKFADRVDCMLYDTCGCNIKRAKEVLKECLNRNKLKEKRR